MRTVLCTGARVSTHTLGDIVQTYTVVDYLVMAYKVMADKVMAFMVMAHVCDDNGSGASMPASICRRIRTLPYRHMSRLVCGQFHKKVRAYPRKHGQRPIYLWPL